MDNYPNTIIKPFKTEVDDYIKSNYLYDAERIDSNHIALGTTNGGIVIINNNGELKQVINTNRGLQNNSIHDIFIDENENVWVSLNHGISFIDIKNCGTVYNEYYGIKEEINSFINFKGKSYFGSFNGIYSLPQYKLQNKDDKYNLDNVNGYFAYCFDFINIQNHLFAAGNSGILKIEGNNAELVVKQPRVINFAKSMKIPNRLFLGLYPGIAYVDYIIREQNDSRKGRDSTIEFGEVKYINDIYDPINSIATDDNGDLWIATNVNGIIQIKIDPNSKNDFRIIRYGLNNGLSQLSGNMVYNVNGDIIVCSSDGIFKMTYNNANDSIAQFVKENTYGAIFNQNKNNVLKIIPDKSQNIWVGSIDAGIVFMKKNNNSYDYIDIPFRKIPTRGLNNLFLDQDDILWASTSDGLFRIDGKEIKASKKEHNSLIRKVIAGNDSILFKGTFFDSSSEKGESFLFTSKQQPPELFYKLNYKFNSVLFQYSSTFYENSDQNKYKYYLEGFDEGWSTPTQKTEKEYTNLREGNYCFKVISINIYGEESTEGLFYFAILPPWYRTALAYFGYILCLLFIIIISVRLYTIYLKKINERLEK